MNPNCLENLLRFMLSTIRSRDIINRCALTMDACIDNAYRENFKELSKVYLTYWIKAKHHGSSVWISRQPLGRQGAGADLWSTLQPRRLSNSMGSVHTQTQYLWRFAVLCNNGSFWNRDLGSFCVLVSHCRPLKCHPRSTPPRCMCEVGRDGVTKRHCFIIYCLSSFQLLLLVLLWSMWLPTWLVLIIANMMTANVADMALAMGSTGTTVRAMAAGTVVTLWRLWWLPWWLEWHWSYIVSSCTTCICCERHPCPKVDGWNNVH